MATPISVSRPDDVGPALREARLAEGMTQSALSEIARVGRQWLNAFEAGDKPSAPLDMVLRVVAALDFPVTLTRTPTSLSNADEVVFDLDAIVEGRDP